MKCPLVVRLEFLVGDEGINEGSLGEFMEEGKRKGKGGKEEHNAARWYDLAFLGAGCFR